MTASPVVAHEPSSNMLANGIRTVNDLSLFRLDLLRAVCAIIAVGPGIVVSPGVIHHEKPWELMEGVVQ